MSVKTMATVVIKRVVVTIIAAVVAAVAMDGSCDSSNGQVSGARLVLVV